MRFRTLLLAPALFLAACAESSPTSPSTSSVDLTSVLTDYSNSATAAFDAAGVGAAQFPDGLKLTTEQKAAIEALHAAFMTTNKADIDALKAIADAARAAKESGKGDGDIRAIMLQAAPILLRMKGAFDRLQADINNVYTAEQKAWLAAHQPKPCGPDGPPKLTEAQMQQIRGLQDAFMNATKDDVALIRATAEQAHQAAKNGATKEAVNAILHQADAAQARVRAAEQKLQHDLEGVLTAEQLAARCKPGPIQPRK